MMRIAKNMPEAYAKIKGNSSYPDIEGTVSFYDFYGGTMVVAEIYGLPDGKNPKNENQTDKKQSVENAVNGNFHGFHIHAGGSCSGTPEEPFKNADGHYNPKNTAHPNHAGDLPPLLANDGVAFSAVYTDRFHPEEVVGRTVIIHENPDDFMTQPSGNAGAMIACGEIVS